MPNEIGIVLTATIIPNAIYTVYGDAQRRKAEYLRAINFYKHFAPVYFLENSSYPLLSDPDFAEIENVNLIKFPLSVHFRKGKGYQEFQMIDEWIRTDENLPKRFIKITGRYIIKNFKKIFMEYITEKSNCILIDQNSKNKVALTQLFCSDSYCYKEKLSGFYLDCDDEKGEFAEKVLYRKLIDSNLDFKIFRNKPNYEYISGSTGSYVKENVVKFAIKNMIRKIMYNIYQNKYITLKNT